MQEYFTVLLVGTTVDKARLVLKAIGHELRVVSVDDKPKYGFCDLRTNRINVAVQDGVVSSVLGNG